MRNDTRRWQLITLWDREVKYQTWRKRSGTGKRGANSWGIWRMGSINEDVGVRREGSLAEAIDKDEEEKEVGLEVSSDKESLG